jgi:hypothetical protein
LNQTAPRTIGAGGDPTALGQAALELVRAALAAKQIPGAILFFFDELDRADLPAFERHATKNGPRVVFLSIGGSEVDDLLPLNPQAVT